MLNNFEIKLGYKFKDKNLIKKSLTHKSYSKLDNNEKLEFLGDRVLGLVLSKKIYQLYPDAAEGDLDKRFAYLVNKKTCLKIGKKIGLNNYIFLGSVYKKKSNIEDKIIADACEALIGAVYIDGGLPAAEQMILYFWDDEIKKTIKTEIDSKTKLQEFSLKIHKKLPTYKTLKSYGKSHALIFKVSVKIINSEEFIGTGKSIKIAQQDAAQKLLSTINVD